MAERHQNFQCIEHSLRTDPAVEPDGDRFELGFVNDGQKTCRRVSGSGLRITVEREARHERHIGAEFHCEKRRLKIACASERFKENEIRFFRGKRRNLLHEDRGDPLDVPCASVRDVACGTDGRRHKQFFSGDLFRDSDRRAVDLAHLVSQQELVQSVEVRPERVGGQNLRPRVLVGQVNFPDDLGIVQAETLIRGVDEEVFLINLGADRSVEDHRFFAQKLFQSVIHHGIPYFYDLNSLLIYIRK